ncbi:hypothetical protein [Streptomyces sp. TLI_171]|uniref:hypothetical protein n=1 Tax=Streptomyces sp. TLI_171 TaxID=1938859 RepID=UPI000C6AC386|nr:hypothetical protein [Streptomyces sp. TLI_171]RKE05020.1 hypothetical protein BX266_7264 [Streptomyces sp. TLI_171]
MAARPLPGLGEQEAVVRLHRLAETVDAVSSLTYAVWAEFREHGAAAAREVWDDAPLEVRRCAAAQMLIVYCQTIGGDAGTLNPRDTVRLIGAAVPVTW